MERLLVYLPLFMIEAWPRRCSRSRQQQCCSNSERGVQHSGRCRNRQTAGQPPKATPPHPPIVYFRSVTSCFDFLGESLSRPQTPYAATPTGGNRRMAAPTYQVATAAVLPKDRARGPAVRPEPQSPNRRATAQGDAAPSPYCVFPISYFLL